MSVTTVTRRPRNKKHVRSIIKDIEKMKIDIPDDIKIEAERQSLRTIYDVSVRKKKKKYNMASSVYNAHNALNIVVDPVEIGRLFNLSKSEMYKAVNSSDNKALTFHFPHECIPGYLEYLNDINTPKFRQRAKRFAKTIYRLDSTILHEHPQNVAAAIIMIVCSDLGIIIESKDLFYKNIEKSSGTIEKQKKIILSIYHGSNDKIIISN